MDTAYIDVTVPERKFSSGEIAQFNRDGYFVARQLVGRTLCERMKAAALEHLAREMPPVEYEADLRYPGAPQSREAKGGRTVRRLLQACSREPMFRHWATSTSLRNFLAPLVRGRVMLVQAHHNCIMTKHPHYGSLTGWHQDIRYWSFRRPELISVWLALGAESDANGGLWIVPGSHALDFDRARFDEMLFLSEDAPANRALLDQRIAIALDPGDVLFFHCRLLHAAGRNHSGETKYSVVFTYSAADNPPIDGTRSAALPLIALD